MVSLGHIVNPVAVAETSDLHVAQPVTFESMRIAKRLAADRVDVRQVVTCYSEDLPVAPPDFRHAGVLERSVLDYGSFAEPRKLPLLGDILDRLYAASEGCDHLIYTNVDIALMPSFYLTVARLIEDGHDAFVINRRTIADTYTSPAELPLMYADVGEPHPGHDCFVFPREAYPRFRLGRVCLGLPPVGRALLLNLAAFAQNVKVFKELHVTFHIGDDQAWSADRFRDLRDFNRAEVVAVLRVLEAEVQVPHRRAFVKWSRKTNRQLVDGYEAAP